MALHSIIFFQSPTTSMSRNFERAKLWSIRRKDKILTTRSFLRLIVYNYRRRRGQMEK